MALALAAAVACSPETKETCKGASTECGGTCVSLQSDGANCGACGNACGAGLVCSTGTCAVSCQASLSACSSSCVDLQSDRNNCGDCNVVCAVGAACDAGTCVSVLTGAGTSGSPYTTTPPLANCGAYHMLKLVDLGVAIDDAIYTTRPSGSNINVYCDMTNGGVTYEDFGMGLHTGTYAGWTMVGGPDFAGSPQFDAAFSYLYNRNGGLLNLQNAFVTNNCCIMNTTLTNRFGLAGASYMYPAISGSTSSSCSPAAGYTATRYQLYLATLATPVVKVSFTPGEAGTVTYTSTCAGTAYPAIFVKRY